VAVEPGSAQPAEARQRQHCVGRRNAGWRKPDVNLTPDWNRPEPPRTLPQRDRHAGLLKRLKSGRNPPWGVSGFTAWFQPSILRPGSYLTGSSQIVLPRSRKMTLGMGDAD